MRHAILFAAFLGLGLRALPQCAAIAHGPAPALHLAPRTDRGGAAQFVIPTLVHVHYPDGVTLLSPERIQQLIDQANLDLRGLNSDVDQVCSLFASEVGDLSVELRLAHIDQNGQCTSGIDYDHYSVQPDIAGYEQNTARYLNIHVLLLTNSFSVIPYNGMPAGTSGDAVSLSLYDALHTRTLAHEVGHWLGLHHTFGDTNTSGVDCGDDGVDDTPITRGSVVGTCDTTLSTCTPGVIENVDNFMDYSTCAKMFTQGQAAVVQAIMTSPDYPRQQFWDPANLEATGVYQVNACPMHAEFDHRSSVGCGAMQVTFTPLCTGQIPDQVYWSLPGGAPASSEEVAPTIAYATSGTYVAQLIACNGTLCDTVQHSFTITVNDPGSNGLPMVTQLPFTEDFENNFSFPQPHVVIADHGGPTFLVSDQAGYQSTHCAYLPGSLVQVQDTADIVIGNFDLTSTTAPGISLLVAASNYDTAWYQAFDVRLRDLCGYLQGVFLHTWAPSEFAVASTPHFVPSSDAEWMRLTALFPPGSTGIASGEVVLRVRRPWQPQPPFVPEDFYLDDITIGEMPTTAIAQTSGANPFQLFPDPASDLVHVRVAGEGAGRLLVMDLTGRLMLPAQRIHGAADVDVASWPRGCYLVTVETGQGRAQQRLVVR